MKSLNLRTFFTLTVLIFIGCSENEEITLQNITVEEVKSFYNSLPKNAKGRGADIDIVWDHVVYKDLVDREALLFPIDPKVELYVSGGENVRRFPVASTSIAFAYKEEGNVHLEQIQMVPTTNSDPFTGFITVNDWNGEEKHVFHFKEGVFQDGQNENGRVSGLDCTTTHYWYCTQAGSEPSDSDPCSYDGSSTSCNYSSDLGIYENLAGIAPDEGSNGGTGGSSGADNNNCPSPLDPSVMVPCNETTCGEGYEPDGEGGCKESWSEDIELYQEPQEEITDIEDYLHCFSSSMDANITLYVDQPKAGKRDTWSGWATDPDVGHTFISISQGSHTRILGFYPGTGVNPFSRPSVSGILVNDEGHAYDVKITAEINSGQFTSLLSSIYSYAETYDLNEYNCTDFGIDCFREVGIDLADTYGSWPGGGGSNPGDLGEDLRSMMSTSEYSVTRESGVSPRNTGDCD